MKIVDLHSDVFTDIAWRVSQGERQVFDRLHYPALRAGGVDTVICVFWVEERHLRQASPRFRDLRSRVLADLARSEHANVVAEPAQLADAPEGRINIVLGLEGMNFFETDAVLDSEQSVDEQMQQLHENGIRHAMLVWNDNNALASGTGAAHPSPEPGLSAAGRRVVRSMQQRGWALDVSHLDVSSFWGMLEATEAPIMASHSNAFARCPHERNLRDEQLQALAERDGLIGLNAYYAFVDEEDPNLDAFIDHAVHICSLIGVRHVGFGFDFLDFLPTEHGGSFMGGRTRGLESHRDIPALIERMSARGFSEIEIAQIAHVNARQWLSRTAPATRK